MVRARHLDGLRALAILLVVTFHTIQFHPWLATHHQWFWTFVLSQGHGVQLFFVLSGMCLAYPTLARLEQTGSVDFDVARFAARRIVRIMPSYWIAIVTLMLAVAVLARLHIHPGGGMPNHLNLGKIAEQALLFNLRPEWLNGAFWTLPIEVHWYFACPILLWLWTRSRRAFVLLMMLCWFASFTTRFQAPDVKALPAFMLGIVAAELLVRKHAAARYAPLAFVVLAAAGFVQEFTGNGFAYISWELAMFALVVAAGESQLLGRIFSARVFAPFAAASYSIYLVHSPVLGTIERYLPPALPVGAALLLSGACGVAVGLLFSLVAEKPFRRGPLRNALLTRLDARLPDLFRRVGVEPSLALDSRPRSVESVAPIAGQVATNPTALAVLQSS